MADERNRFEETLAKLKRERDELAVKMTLAKAEARDEWQALQAKIDAWETQSRPEVRETASGVGESLELAADVIMKGFDRLRKLH